MLPNKYYSNFIPTFRKSKIVAAATMIFLLFFLQNSYAFWPFTSGSEKYVAKVGDKIISEDDFVSEVNKLHTSSRVGKELSESKSFAKQDYSKFLDELIDRKLLVIEAENLKLDDDKYFKDKLDNYLLNISLQRLRSEEILEKVEVTEEELKERFRELLKKKEAKKHDTPEDKAESSSEAPVADAAEAGENAETREMTPKERDAIKQILINEKSKVMEDEYFTALRNKAKVTIYSDVLNGISPDNHALLEETVADVNGELVSARTLLNAMKKTDKYGDDEYKKSVLDLIVIHKLLDQEAIRRQYINDESVRAKLEKYRERLLADVFPRRVIVPRVDVDENDVLEHYNKNIEGFRKSDLVDLRIIVVADEGEALRIYNDLKNNADFSTMAKQNSIDPSSEKGGDLGWMEINTLPPDMRALLYNSTPLQILGPFGLKGGYAVIEFRDLKKGELTPLADVQKNIYIKLARESYESILGEYMKRLRDTIPIKINREALRGIEGR